LCAIVYEYLTQNLCVRAKNDIITDGWRKFSIAPDSDGETMPHRAVGTDFCLRMDYHTAEMMNHQTWADFDRTRNIDSGE